MIATRDRQRVRRGFVNALGVAAAGVVLTGAALSPSALSSQQQSLTVRNGDRARTIPLVAHQGGGLALRLDQVAEALGGQLVTEPGQRYRLQLGANSLTVIAGTALVIAGDDTVPAAQATYRSGTQVLAPVSLVSELLPRMVNGLIYDADRRELRRFAIVAAPRSAKDNAPPQVSTPSQPRPTGANSSATGNRRRLVVVDAGHGGVDPGMSAPLAGGGRLLEKNVTLAVSRELQSALERRNVSVVMTRTRDTLIALADRGRIANNAKGDLFVSIHVNAANPRWSQPGAARGFETYFLAEAKTEDEKRVEAMENESIKFETVVDASRDDPLGFIIRDMAQNEHLRESSRLADLIQGGMKAVHPGPNRGVKQAGFRVLVSAFMPAVLVEIGYGTNSGDAAWMTSPARQRELADAIADAVVAYLTEYERKVGGN